MRSVAALLLAAVLSACNGSPTSPATLPEVDPVVQARRTAEGVMLQTDRASYKAGDVVRLTLRNDAEYALGVNLCSSTLEFHDGDRWIVAPRQPERVCTLELRALPPRDSHAIDFELGEMLAAGEYRFRTDLENLTTGERAPHASNHFTIAR